MKGRKPSLVPGVCLIAAGAWWLIRENEWWNPGVAGILPFLYLFLAAALIFEALRRKTTGALVWGVFFLQVAVFSGLIKFQVLIVPHWDETWPLLLFALGLGYFTAFLFYPRKWGLLIPSGLLLWAGSGLTSALIDEPPVCMETLHDVLLPVMLLAAGIRLLIGQASRVE